MNRKRMMWVIMVASAVTGVARYVLMGATSSSHNPAEFPMWFWIADFTLWGVLSIAEALCVGYMFMTNCEKLWDKISLSILELVVLIAIAFTVGMMTQSVASGKTIYQLIAGDYFQLWSFSMGAYAPLMMAGAGVAYRVQPVDQNRVVVDQSAMDEVEKLRATVADLQQRNEALSDTHKYGKMFAVMSDINQARLVDEMKKIANGQTPQLEAAAKEELKPYTRSRAKVKK